MTTTVVNPMLTPADLQHVISEQIATQTAAFNTRLQTAQAERGAAAQGVDVAPKPVIAPALFLEHLTAMQNHYTTGAGAVAARLGTAAPTSGTATVEQHIYKLPEELVFHPAIKFTASPMASSIHVVRPAAQAATAGDLAVDAMAQRIHADALATIQQHANDLVAATQKAVANKMTTSAWAAEMNALRDRDKNIANQKINQMYADAGKIGTAHPEQRTRILLTTNHGSNLFNGLFAGIIVVGGTVEHDVASAIHAVVSPVAGAVKTVGNWAVGAVGSVGKFLGSIF